MATTQVLTVMSVRRRVLGLTQQDIAAQLGCSQAEVSWMENNRQDVGRFREKLSQILTIEPDWLQKPYDLYLHTHPHQTSELTQLSDVETHDDE